MRALVADPSRPQAVRLAEVAEPVAGPSQVLVEVHHASLTGASGGVGRFAVRLASIAGGHVIAAVGSAARGEGLAEAGADEVVVGLQGIGTPVDVVLDSVGGPHLVAAWQLLAPGGSL
jgi:NADPH2:quinone reductase